MRHRRTRIRCGLLVVLPLIAAAGLQARADEQAAQRTEGSLRSPAAAASKVLPSVVQIKAVAPPRGDAGPLALEEALRDLSRKADPTRPQPRLPRHTAGSGVVFDAKGIIVTNGHLVEDADEVTVELSDGRRLEVTEIKWDRPTNLAILRVETDKPLPAAQFGDSDKLQIGEPVIAAGFPFGLPLSVTSGIISGKGRTLPSVRRASFLQTDAAINPGSAGGPLVNLQGEVIGINTATYHGSGGAQGIGFAIPSNLVIRIVTQLVERGRVERAYLGVVLADLPAKTAEKLGLDTAQGAWVTGVAADSPAAEAGIQTGDVIVSFSGRPVRKPADLQQAVEGCSAGSKHDLEIRRDDDTHALEVVLKPLPEGFGRPTPQPPDENRSTPPKPEEDPKP